jgi:hypothetical protein
MRPIGIHTRRNGEEVLIHECLGCGKRDPNRIAADDNPVLLLEIPIRRFQERFRPIPESADQDMLQFKQRVVVVGPMGESM